MPSGIPDDWAAVLDPFGNAVHTALAFPLVGEDVLVTGAGPIGQMAAAVARFVGARYVVITDVNPERLAMAQRMGAVDRAVDVSRPGTDLQDVMAELGMIRRSSSRLTISTRRSLSRLSITRSTPSAVAVAAGSREA